MWSPRSEPPTPDSDGGDLSGVVIACAVVTLALAAVALAARFYTRMVIVRVLAAEDWFVLAAWLLSAGTTVGTILQAKAALGRHTWTLMPQDFKDFGRASWITILFYQLSLACSKVSIILLYIQVLTYNYARRAAYVVLVIVVVYNVAGFVSTMTLCIPIQAVWDPSVTGSCHRDPRYMWLMIGFHIGTDFLIFLLPIPVVLRMTVPLGQKVMLLFIFALGLLICLISVLRAIWIKAVFKSPDFSWDLVAVANWNSIEVNTAITCVCLLVTKPLFTKLWHKIWPKSAASSRTESTGSRRQPAIGLNTYRSGQAPPPDRAFFTSREQLFQRNTPG
ncbi:hypothetical protein QBC44DRAFT_46292 [Cladorrhinum sp. PSN332]|nr:hypothetical protein QBC44DRAFT_46292 [Cladorrhinum sp. PSN332]